MSFKPADLILVTGQTMGFLVICKWQQKMSETNISAFTVAEGARTVKNRSRTNFQITSILSVWTFTMYLYCTNDAVFVAFCLSCCNRSVSVPSLFHRGTVFVLFCFFLSFFHKFSPNTCTSTSSSTAVTYWHLAPWKTLAASSPITSCLM